MLGFGAQAFKLRAQSIKVSRQRLQGFLGFRVSGHMGFSRFEEMEHRFRGVSKLLVGFSEFGLTSDGYRKKGPNSRLNGLDFRVYL